MGGGTVSDQMPDPYDRLMGAIDGLPDVAKTRPATVRVVAPMGVGGSVTYIVQTYRQERRGDTIFLEVAAADRVIRIPLPPKVAAVIARQRDSLTKQSRSRVGKRLAAERKERGEAPAFLKPRSA
jgi:hypothetical protein